MNTTLSKTEETVSNDHRPNCGLREGDVAHAEVNAMLRQAAKTVIFGQQNRIRAGVLMEDEKLSRFHAGHSLVKFFYGAIRQLPEYMLNAVLDRGISVILVKDTDLLVFHDVRRHQSTHAGRTRKTVYLPDKVIQSAFEKGYDYWALGEVIIQEAWVLLDYLLILDLVRYSQRELHQRQMLGPSFIKDTLQRSNLHRSANAENAENEYAQFYRHYHEIFFAWDRAILDRDPYELADEVFDEQQERVWAEIKVDSITHAYRFPTYFNLDRDIVHGAVYQLAEAHELALEPMTVEDLVHDLYDAARFKVSRQIKMDVLMDKLLAQGAPGLKGLVDAIARERATSRGYISENQSDGYDAIDVFRNKLQEHSSSSTAGMPGSIANDFDDLLGNRLLGHIYRQFDKLKHFSLEDQLQSRDYLESLVGEAVALARPDLSAMARQQAVAPPAYAGPAQQVQHWMALAESLLRETPPDQEDEWVGKILIKLDTHPNYQEVFLAQVRALDIDVANDEAVVSPSVEPLYALVPPEAEQYSSDPDGVKRRLGRLERLRRTDGDGEEIMALLVGVLIRLDRAENYYEITEQLKMLGRPAEKVLVEVVESDETKAWPALRQQAVFLLNELQGS